MALRDPARLALVDTGAGAVRTAPAPGAARHLTLAKTGELLVPAESTNTLARVSLPSGKVKATTKVGRHLHDAARVGETIFVADEFGGSVAVVWDDKLVRELSGLVQPGGLTATGGRVAVVDVRTNTMHVFDARTFRDVAVLPAGKGPSHGHPIGPGWVAVADTRGNALRTYQITGAAHQLDQLSLDGRAYGLSTDPKRAAAHTTLANKNQVVRTVVRADGTLGKARGVGTIEQPHDVVADPVGGCRRFHYRCSTQRNVGGPRLRV